MPRQYVKHRECTDPNHDPNMPKVIPDGESLAVKRVEWREAGAGGKMLRSRTLVYQCEDCRERDPHYNHAYYAGATRA